MRKRVVSFAVLLAAGGLAGCGYTPEQRAVNGAAIGAGTGALLGAATGGSTGTVLGLGALGAATGAIIGANSKPQPAYAPPPPPDYAPPPPPPRCRSWGYDSAGIAFCSSYYSY